MNDEAVTTWVKLALVAEVEVYRMDELRRDAASRLSRAAEKTSVPLMWSAKMKRMKGRNEPPPLILELLSALPTFNVAMKPKLLTPPIILGNGKTSPSRSGEKRRRLRREKQREDNLGRAKENARGSALR